MGANSSDHLEHNSGGEKSSPLSEHKETGYVFDENPEITDGEKLPTHSALKILRYRTLKKSTALGWWSAIVLLEDHKKRMICFYRWKKKNNEWKRDKKLAIRKYEDWRLMKEAIEAFITML